MSQLKQYTLKDQMGFDFTIEPVIPLATPKPSPKTRIVVREEPDTEPWSESDIFALKEALIIDGFQTIADSRASMKTRNETLAWILSSDATWPFSFENCCRHLGYQPDELRVHCRELFPQAFH